MAQRQRPAAAADAPRIPNELKHGVAPAERWQHGGEYGIATIADFIPKAYKADGSLIPPRPEDLRSIQHATSGIDQLLRTGRITSAEVNAAARFRRDYEFGVCGACDPDRSERARRSEDGENFTARERYESARLDAQSRHREAAAAVGRRGTDLLVAFTVECLSLSAIAARQVAATEAARIAAAHAARDPEARVTDATARAEVTARHEAARAEILVRFEQRMEAAADQANAPVHAFEGTAKDARATLEARLETARGDDARKLQQELRRMQIASNEALARLHGTAFRQLDAARAEFRRDLTAELADIERRPSAPAAVVAAEADARKRMEAEREAVRRDLAGQLTAVLVRLSEHFEEVDARTRRPVKKGNPA